MSPAGGTSAGRRPEPGTAQHQPAKTVTERLVELVEQVGPGRRTLVAVDGPDAAGKTTLAQDLAQRLRRPCVQVSVDGWHHPRAVRLRRGEESAEGYYRDSFDHRTLVRECLAPFTAGARSVRTVGFDHQSDTRVEAHQEVAPGAVLVVEGVFLLRPELRGWWDLSVYLHVPEGVSLARALRRDTPLLGGAEQVRRRYEERYLPGQAIYRSEAVPLDSADVVLENSRPEDPVVVRWGHAGTC